MVSADFRTGAIHALSRKDRVAWVEALFAKLRAVAAREFPPGVRVSIGGGELGQAAANNSTVVRHKLENMGQIGTVIFVLSALVFRSLGAGLLVLAPLVCAALVNLGVMGWIGSWLSFATASYTAMGVSLGADFAIYLLFRLREEVRAGHPLEAAITGTMRSSGRAIFFVASAIAAGNATLLVSDFALWRQLGGYVVADDDHQLSRDADGDPGAGADLPAALPRCWHAPGHTREPTSGRRCHRVRMTGERPWSASTSRKSFATSTT